jgi:hypothetical protein
MSASIAVRFTPRRHRCAGFVRRSGAGCMFRRHKIDLANAVALPGGQGKNPDIIFLRHWKFILKLKKLITIADFVETYQLKINITKS